MSLFDSIRHLVIEDGDCLRWRAGCSAGHPSWRVGGKSVLVRRVMFEEEHGPIPRGKILRVTCGMLRCLNREHWRLTTYKAVALECGAAGLMSGHLRSAKIAAVKRSGPQAKISDEDAATIFASGDTCTVLAERYGLNPSTICRIKRGQVRRRFDDPWLSLRP